MITPATRDSRSTARIRYDYHTLAEQVNVVVFVVPLAVMLFFLLFLQRSHSAAEWVVVILGMAILFCAAILGYKDLKSTFIEVSDEGILFRSWRRNIFSPWSDLYKIKAIIRSHKIYTRAGNFYIMRIEPAQENHRGIPGMLATDRLAYTRELIDLIKQRAPHATVVYSILNRPL